MRKSPEFTECMNISCLIIHWQNIKHLSHRIKQSDMHVYVHPHLLGKVKTMTTLIKCKSYDRVGI